MPRFEAYWLYVQQPPQTHEDPVLERIALWQVWRSLHRFEQNALLALADADGSHAMAAHSLGIPLRTLHTYLYRARRSFYALWFAPETPTGKWDSDKPRHCVKGTITATTLRHRRAERQRRATRRRERPEDMTDAA